jgi:predicted phage terminase large subunit-like protein
MKAPSIELKVEALYNCWAFLDLINYKGGTHNFDSCHYDFVLVLQAYQLWQQGRLEGDLLKRWQRLVDVGENVYPTPRNHLRFPRGHLKSTLIIGWILWRTYRNPNFCLLHATNVRELSESFIRELRSYYEDEELQTTVWNSRPHIRGPLVPPLDRVNRRAYKDTNDAADKKIVWSNYQLQLLRSQKRKEPTILSTSVKAKSTGNHFHCVVFDDIVDFDNSETALKQRKVQRWAADIASVVTVIPEKHQIGVIPDGQVFSETTEGEYIVTGTHYNPNDYYSFIEKNARVLGYNIFSRNIYANGTDNTDGYLWGKFTEEMEVKLRAELEENPGVFEAQYLNLVNNPELQVLSTILVKWISHEKLLEGANDNGVTYRNPGTGEYETIVPIIAIDPASSLKSTADFTAICVGGKSVQGNLVLLDFSVGRYTPEFIEQETARLAKLWHVKQVFCESVGFQGILKARILKYFIDQSIYCAILDYSPVKWGNKLKRIELQLSPYFSVGNVIMNGRLKNQATIMNTFDFFGRGGKDDPPDAAAIVAEKALIKSTSPSKLRTRGRHGNMNGSFNSDFGGIY